MQMSAEVSTLKKNIVFAFFNGEAYDYIGSSRFALDMSEGKFPYATLAKGYDTHQRRAALPAGINAHRNLC